MKDKFKKSYLLINIVLLVFIFILLLNFFTFKLTSFLFVIPMTLIPFGILALILGYEKKKQRFTYESFFYILVFTILFLIITYLSGLFIGFAKSIYKLNVSNLLNNILPYLILIITSELLRFEIVRKGEGNNLAYVLVTILFILIDSTIYFTTYDISSFDGKIKFVCLIVLPSTFKNILLLYLTKQGGMRPSITYRLLMDLTRVFILPIAPNFGLYFESTIYTILPIMLLLIINASLKKFNNKEQEKITIKHTYTYKYALLALLLLFTLSINILASCAFKYCLISIGSNSMNPLFYRGDAVIYEKVTDVTKLNIGDIMVFRKEGRRVVHRIIEIKIIDGEYIFYTKGDNNNAEDGYPIVKEEIDGKYITHIKGLGIISVLLYESYGK